MTYGLWLAASDTIFWTARSVMPTIPMSDEELDAVVAFIKSNSSQPQ